MVNTATGQASSDDLGKTLVHEHFAFGFPGFGATLWAPYDPKAIVKTSIEVVERAKSHGVETVVDATANECGRDVEVLREISERADPDRVMIGHMDGSTDQAYHLATLAHGVKIVFDRYGIQGLVGMPMDELRTACLLGLLGTGHGDRTMLSHDTVNVWLGRPPVFPEEAEELLANWHITHLLDNVLPALKKAGITDEQLDGIFFENPNRLLARERSGRRPQLSPRREV